MLSGSSRSAAGSSDAGPATAEREARNREKYTAVDAEMAAVWIGNSTVRDRKGKSKRESKREMKKTGRLSLDVFTRDVVLLPSADCELVPSHARPPC